MRVVDQSSQIVPFTLLLLTVPKGLLAQPVAEGCFMPDCRVPRPASFTAGHSTPISISSCGASSARAVASPNALRRASPWLAGPVLFFPTHYLQPCPPAHTRRNVRTHDDGATAARPLREGPRERPSSDPTVRAGDQPVSPVRVRPSSWSRNSKHTGCAPRTRCMRSVPPALNLSAEPGDRILINNNNATLRA
jgi:hypothetical protein